MTAVTRVCLVTGASSGIGAATARTLAAPGTAIALHARKNKAGVATARKPEETHAVPVDVQARGRMHQEKIDNTLDVDGPNEKR